MLVIGERINATSKTISAAIINKNAEFIKDIALKQIEGGANMLDVNAGMGSTIADEIENLCWLVETIREVTPVPLCIDSTNVDAIKKAIKLLPEQEKSSVMLNSVSGENKKLRIMLPLITEYNCSVIALCMDDNEIPETVDKRVKTAENLINILAGEGLDKEKIYVDPLVFPISVNNKNAKITLEVLRVLKNNFPDVKTVCGLSNVSYGLPFRPLLNRVFLSMCVLAELDAVIADTLDKKLMSVFNASVTLAGKDEFCSKFLNAFRAGRLGDN